MNIEINICTANSCKIIIKESKGDYISEDSTNVVKNRFKFSDTVSIDLLQHNKSDGYKLQDNEVIQFRTPNLKTSVTYPSYVNYFLHLETRKSKPAIPATFQSIVNSDLLDSNDK